VRERRSLIEDPHRKFFAGTKRACTLALDDHVIRPYPSPRSAVDIRLHERR